MSRAIFVMSKKVRDKIRNRAMFDSNARATYPTGTSACAALSLTMTATNSTVVLIIIIEGLVEIVYDRLPPSSSSSSSFVSLRLRRLLRPPAGATCMDRGFFLRYWTPRG